MHIRRAHQDSPGARLGGLRDAAVALVKNRNSAELHDSVGHDLTAIAALSEGIAGETGIEQLDRDIASINVLARSGLGDTRRTVRALASGEDVFGQDYIDTWGCSGNPGPFPYAISLRLMRYYFGFM